MRFAFYQRPPLGVVLAVHAARLGEKSGFVQDNPRRESRDVGESKETCFAHGEDGFWGHGAQFTNGGAFVVAAFVERRKIQEFKFGWHTACGFWGLRPRVAWWDPVGPANGFITLEGVSERESEMGLEQCDFIAASGAFAVTIPDPRVGFECEAECGAFALTVQRTGVVARFGCMFKEPKPDKKIR